MAKIYQPMTGIIEIDVLYNEKDAVENAMQAYANDTGRPVAIWTAEEIEGVPVDFLNRKRAKVIEPIA